MNLVTASLLGVFIYLVAFSAFVSLKDQRASVSNDATAQILLGQALFFDPILSGGKQVACATCHHPLFGSSDGVSLGLGDGAHGLGPDRVADKVNLPIRRVSRNAPALFNLAATDFHTLFHDGRLSVDASEPSGFKSPLGDVLPNGVDNIIAAQAFMPVLFDDEMAGHGDENEVSKVLKEDSTESRKNALDILARRVQGIPKYREMFEQVNDEIRDLAYVDIANAIAAYVGFEFRADNSRFDQYNKGLVEFDQAEQLGHDLFYGAAGCSACHSGRFQTDRDFHAIAMPQLGPGKGQGVSGFGDLGRGAITIQEIDNYKFITPSLRNIALTAPYGHSGAYDTLEGVVRHHLDPVASFKSYDRGRAILPVFETSTDWRTMDHDWDTGAILAANQLPTQDLSDVEVGNLIAFLHTLTDPISKVTRLGVPMSVPSGLAVQAVRQ